MVATLLKGEAVVEDIEKWCAKIGHDESNNGDYDNVQPVMAVVWFDTDSYAAEYVRVKADVAAKAGVGYWVYRMPDTAATDEVIAHVQELNRDDRIHGILIQRPVPHYLSQERIMGSVSKAKHIEEYTGGQPDNIASDAMVRLISKYNRQDLLKTGRVRIAGHGNIVTDEFIDEMRRTYPRVRTSPDWPVPKLDAERESMLEADGGIKDTVLITELQHGGGYITPAMVGPRVEMIIDLGFHIVKEAKMGDADPELLERDGLAISPTPGGMLPVLIWVMMERTIKAKMAKSQNSWGCMCQ